MRSHFISVNKRIRLLEILLDDLGDLRAKLFALLLFFRRTLGFVLIIDIEVRSLKHLVLGISAFYSDLNHLLLQVKSLSSLMHIRIRTFLIVEKLIVSFDFSDNIVVLISLLRHAKSGHVQEEHSIGFRQNNVDVFLKFIISQSALFL